MRILRYHPRAASGDGGMSNAIRRWSRALADLGAQSVIGYDDGSPAPVEGVEWMQLSHVNVTGQRIPRGFERALRGVDLLVLHGAWSAHNIVASRAAVSAGVPYLLEPRGAFDPHIVARRRYLKRAWWLAERQVVARAVAVHLFFDEERAHLARLGHTGPFVVAPNGVDAPHQPTWDGGSGRFVLWYGRFDVEHKGVDLLVDGLGHPPAGRRPSVRLHGPDRRGDRARIAERVRAAGLADHVGVGEPVYGSRKEALLATCLGFAYPSRWEGFGIAPAEAVARGVPLLATPYPFAKHLAARGGAIVVPADAAGLAAGLDRLGDPEIAEMAARGSRIVREEFRWADVGRAWLDQVARLL
jgi:glycosyltransferase involved in cell wall biosynthesis